MASDGLLDYAKTGKCRICYRVRKTDAQVKPVGEIRHGYATGHIWECIDVEECEKAAKERLNDSKYRPYRKLIEIALHQGRFDSYKVLFVALHKT